MTFHPFSSGARQDGWSGRVRVGWINIVPNATREHPAERRVLVANDAR